MGMNLTVCACTISKSTLLEELFKEPLASKYDRLLYINLGIIVGIGRMRPHRSFDRLWRRGFRGQSRDSGIHRGVGGERARTFYQYLNASWLLGSLEVVWYVFSASILSGWIVSLMMRHLQPATGLSIKRETSR